MMKKSELRPCDAPDYNELNSLLNAEVDCDSFVVSLTEPNFQHLYSELKETIEIYNKNFEELKLKVEELSVSILDIFEAIDNL
jgi:hypothetical protein|tara:strand:+ start:146 stop:394 length:249 start_codon:yes stop_codon:yes gene_type:complete